MNLRKFKIKKRWLIFILTLTILFAEMFYFSLRRFDVHIEEIYWDKTHEDLNNLRIVFISDLHYGFSMNEEKLKDIVMWVNRLDADIILFGGDLFDHPSTLLPNQTMQDTLSIGLKEMQAKIAKIAVLGNHDHESSLTSAMTSQVLQNGGFDVLVNQMQRLEIGQSAVQIVGIDSSILGNPNIERSLALVNTDELVLVLTHTPDLVTQLPSLKVDWQLSGHSHGGQIALPWIGPIITPPDARLYTNGTYEVNGIRLDVTNGLGTTGIKARLFANPSIHLFILK
jgi:uncharacterized protein